MGETGNTYVNVNMDPVVDSIEDYMAVYETRNQVLQDGLAKTGKMIEYGMLIQGVIIGLLVVLIVAKGVFHARA